MKRPRALFISYTGLIEPLGRAQVVPYLRALAATYEMSVLSFEKQVRSAVEDAQDAQRLAHALGEQGIRWIRRRYHKRPSLPATLFDLIVGIVAAIGLHRRQPLALVHARGYVPGAIAWALKRCCGVPYLFDIRGLQAEEYVDAGHWRPGGLKFRLTKRAERLMLREADGLVTLTEAIRPTVLALPGMSQRRSLPPWEVVPCCVDLAHFRFREEARRRLRAQLGLEQRTVLVYAGSIGTWYLLDEMIAFSVEARRCLPTLAFLALVNGSSQPVRAAFARHGVIEGRDAFVRRAPFEEMPDYLSAADAGIAFIRPCLSKRSSSPTKFAEYLACGLPLVVNAGIGDADALIGADGAGVLVEALTPEGYARAARSLQAQLARPRQAFRSAAQRRFSLERAVESYRRVYGRILAGRAVPLAAPSRGVAAEALEPAELVRAEEGA
jgi:glycosyltransferase involved in cell wall biosynthesis